MKRFIVPLATLALVACQPAKNESKQLTDAQIEKCIDELLPQLTLEEKVAMCHAQSKFTSPGVPRLGIPQLMMSDGPHGVRAEINWDDWGYSGWTNDSCTAFPALTALASTFRPELSEIYGSAVAEEALYRGKDIMLGPGVNIYRTPLCGRNFEYMGEDPYLASVMVVPYIQGMQRHGVASCVKHYALNNQETWRNEVDVHVSERALREIYLPAFEAAVKEGGAWSIMGSYNLFRGQHCCHNDVLINKILKGEWGFDGCVITDWGGAHDTKEAALNGLDIEMGSWTNGLTSNTTLAYDNYWLATPYLEMLKKGELPMSTLDDKVRRILRLMFRTTMSKERGLGTLCSDEHFQTAYKIAAESMVLLKNDNLLLPLDASKKMTIAVIGENATRSMCKAGGSSELKTKREISPLEGIKSRFPNADVVYTMGYASGPSTYGRVLPSVLNADSLTQKAVEVAKSADVVIFVGGLNKSHEQDCEAGDRVALELPFGQNELIEKLLEVNPKMALVLVSGNAVAMPWIDKMLAVMQAWYLGSEAGNAIADALCGVINPSGKLPISFPVRLTDNAVHSFEGDVEVYPGDKANGYKQVYKEDILVGYRWHDTKNIKPLFAFGHGLSYTTFEVKDINATIKGDMVNVTATVVNTGKCDGAEVVQVYVGMNDSKVARATKELKGFKKVDLKAGETKSVSIDIPVKKLAYYNEQKADWEVEQGTYTFHVGTASDDIDKLIELAIK